jgi:uncharacterized delta-60 repeat protein
MMVRLGNPRLLILVLAMSIAATPRGRESLSAQAAGGALDPTFSDDGFFGPVCKGPVKPIVCDLVVNAMALQPDGRFVLAGVDGFAGSGGAFRLLRYMPDGGDDSTFANILADFSSGRDEAFGVAIQSDGKIVAVGDAGVNGTGFAVARYLTDGTLDPSFGAGGKVLTPMGFGRASARGIVIQPDGKLVVAGWSRAFPNTNNRPALVRYLPNGQLDVTFGTGGRTYARFYASAHASALALKPDGRLLVSVTAAGTADVPPGFAVMQYLPTGVPDASFGAAGRAVARSPQLGSANALAVQDDGRIIVGGWGTPASAPDTRVFALIGWTADGALDQSFGAGGAVFTTFPSGNSEIKALALQPDGKLVAGGVAANDFGLARYLPGGALDPTFGSGGLVTTDFPNANGSISALVVQPDAKLVAAGIANGGGGLGGFGGPLPAMARYLP